MSDSKILVILTVLACVALSFLFSGMETGVLALNRFRVRQRMRTGDRRAAVLHRFMENPEEFSLDNPGRQHGGEFRHFQPGVDPVVLLDWETRPLLWALAFLLAVFRFLHCLRTDAQDAVPALSQSLDPVDGAGRFVDSSVAGAVGGGGGVGFRAACSIGRAERPLPDGSLAAGRNCVSSCRNPRRV